MPDLGVGQPLLGKELLVRRLAELAIEALGLRNLRDLGIDKSLRNREMELLGEGEEGLVGQKLVEQRVEVPDYG